MVSKKKLVINTFQIQNLNINTIYANDNKLSKEKYFSEIDEKILNEKEVLVLKIDFDLLPFGKSENKRETKIKTKKRFIDEKNIIFVSERKIFFFEKIKIKKN